jgi:manganese efflux pump family protein
MSVIALITWLITAALGFAMLARWVARGGLRPAGAGAAAGPGTQFPPAVVFGHFLLAAAGLVIWIIYVITDADALTWVALVLLVVVALLGGLLFGRWKRVRGSRMAESAIPPPVAYTHGVFAVVTVILVLLTALGVGG